MKNLNYFLAVIIILITINVFSQTPQIKWWYDVDDSSFGISASGDIDGDGKLEVVFSCYRNDSTVYALNAEDGSLLWKVNTGGCNDVAPMIYDVDMDDSLEVILPSSCNPTTFCFNGLTGDIEWSTYLHGSDSPPTIGDVDNDGKPEILHGNFGGYVTCLNGEDGSVEWDLPVDLNSWIQTAPIILDVDKNGQLDFVVGNWSFGTDHKIFCYRGDNQSLIWETELPNDVMYHGASFADIDNDTYMELVIGTYDGTLLVLNAEDGSLKWDFSFPSPSYIGAPTSIADLNNDGSYEIVFFDGDHLGVLNSTGSLVWDFTIPFWASAFRGAAISDINADDTLDVVFGTSDGEVYALNGSNGDEIWSIDLAAHHDSAIFDIDHAPVIADFDGDSILDIFIVGGYTDYPVVDYNYGRAYAVSTGGSGGPDWQMFRRDTVRSACVPIEQITAINRKNDIQNYFIEVYPNPFSNTVTFEYKLNKVSDVEIFITDISGRKIISLVDEKQFEGSYLLRWNREENCKNGIYFCKFIFNNSVIVKKLTLIE